MVKGGTLIYCWCTHSGNQCGELTPPKLKTDLAQDTAIALLGMVPKEDLTSHSTDICLATFVAALFTIGMKWQTLNANVAHTQNEIPFNYERRTK